MSVNVTWPRTTNVTPEEELLRGIFEYIDVKPDYWADNATLISMVERYRDSQALAKTGGKDG